MQYAHGSPHIVIQIVGMRQISHMTKKQSTLQKEKWKVTTNCLYHKDREQRLALAFEQLVPEKYGFLEPKKMEAENEASEDSTLCSSFQ